MHIVIYNFYTVEVQKNIRLLTLFEKTYSDKKRQNKVIKKINKTQNRKTND